MKERFQRYYKYNLKIIFKQIYMYLFFNYISIFYSLFKFFIRIRIRVKTDLQDDFSTVYHFNNIFIALFSQKYFLI